MKFKGYIYKFKLNASHSVLIDNVRGNVHSHTFIIIMHIKIASSDFVLYNDVEKVIIDYLKKYEEKELNKIEPFDEIEPTLENIGNFLFDEIQKILSAKSIELTKLEISETPARVYIVNAQNKKQEEEYNVKIRKLLLNSLINSCAEDLLNKYKGSKDKVKKQKAVVPVKRILKEKEIEEYHENVEGEDSVEIIKEYKVLPKALISMFFLLLISVLLTLYLKNLGGYPWGIDTYGHIFKADFLYKSIKSGNLYPLLTKYWYNGIQPFRYWAPLTYYILAAFQFASGGDAINAYFIFVIFVFLIGAMGWLMWGIGGKNVYTALILGIVWFFLPENLKVLFFEGNIPRVVITALLPYLFYFLWDFVEYGKKWSILLMSFFMVLITMTHLMIAAMLGVASFIFLFIYSILFKKFLRSMRVIAAMLLSYAICGIWLYPALKGGLASMDSGATSEVMKFFSAKFTLALNPFLRVINANKNGLFYYGISIFVVAILGVFLSKKKSLPGFITSLIIFFGSTTAFLPIISKLPLNQLFWMIRFTPIAYALFVISILNWKSCKVWFKTVILIFIIADSALSFNFKLYPEGKSYSTAKELKIAKNITNQRISLLDDSTYQSYASYYICSTGKEVPYSYGWAWQGASTAQNIVLLNTALENGYYKYMFDRSLEMGCDTVLVRKSVLKYNKKNFNSINIGAKLSGYSLYSEDDDSYVFHRKTPKNFGVITKYYGLCLGKNSSDIPLQYPSFKLGDSCNIEDYSLKDLMKYKVIYLSGFSYNNRKAAEKMLTALSKSGVKVIVDMNKIPIDPIINRMTLLGVNAEPITFNNKMPNLFFKGQKYKPSVEFNEKYKKWSTVYLGKVPEVIGFSWINDRKIPFLGKGNGNNKNVYFIGFNLMFNGMENEDTKSIDIMNSVMGTELLNPPQRNIVPLDVKYYKNLIKIKSPKNNVNTTLAFLDAYKGDKGIYKDQNLLNVVKKGETNISITYPYLIQGAVLSILGLIGLVILIIL
ncbi:MULTISPECIES: 6-pyruvoyl-tetrahydropterin synthase-related protein [Clostridium]|uniref:6-pyruvoyl-tetrahydropterin synthase-related protein n=1 Tax=Clostridium TaxID=1485 RepID=UPI0008269063|nr:MULTISPECIES: 6-pyruvoyl-tetrahydropterin synthase-related protein [Clostridium]PJI09515.1 6-pyruvoyl tetrahydrobiopterin synthase [Clostridium sp. CT7]